MESDVNDAKFFGKSKIKKRSSDEVKIPPHTINQ